MQTYREISSGQGKDITTISQIVLSPNRNRAYALLINDSDTVIYLMKGKTAVANQGIRLNAEGGSYEINKTNLYKGEIAAIHGGIGNKVLLINEDEGGY